MQTTPPTPTARPAGATGGWFSLWRTALGLSLVALGAQALLGGATPLVLVAWLGLALALTLGWTLRNVSVPLAIAVILETDVAALTGGHAWFVGLLLVASGAPPAPYGSWSARGRIDPGAGWRLPLGSHRAAQVLAALWWVALGWWWVLADDPAPLSWGFGLAGALCHWLGMAPSWVPPAGPELRLVGYDGDCGLCHRAVRFLLAEDTRGELRFAPLQGPSFAEAVPGALVGSLPDSVVVVTNAGEVLWKASAAKALLLHLGGGWRVIGHLMGALPLPLLNLGYDAVAAVRHRVFAKPAAACPLLPPELRARFWP